MIRIGISGCGAVAQLYYRPAFEALQASGEAVLVGAFDPERAAARTLCDAFPNARPLGTLEELLALELDLLIVASPPARHADQACAALDAGVTVLCEKPMALSVADAERMAAAAGAGETPYAVGMVRRFLPQPRTIRDLLARGTLGKLRRIEIFEGGPFDWPVASPSYFDPQRGGGGVLEDVGIHVLDLLRWWLGEPDEVRFADDALGGVAANCSIELRFGATEVVVRLSRDWHRPNGWRFAGDAGWLHWAIHERDELELGRPGEAVGAIVGGTEGTSYPDAVAAQIQAIAVTADATLAGAEDGVRTMRLVERCRQARAPMAMEWL